MEIKSRFFNDPEVSFFLFGPRGTGKSTWLKMQFKEALYIDLLSPDLFRLYSARPERLREIIEGNPDKKIVIIDEIQKVPVILDIIHQLIEEKKGIRFILTGSSSRKLKRTGIDLLAGRAILKTLHPFIASELGDIFNIENAMQYGLIPLIVNSKKPIESLKAYVSLYLSEEIKMEGLVRNIGDFSRFLEVISFSNASILNSSEIARECQVGRKAVEGYLSVLNDLMVAHTLQVFTKKAKRHLISHPKFYFFDTGVFKALRPSGTLDRPHEIEGSALETLVLQNLIAWNAYSENRNQIYFWRTRAGIEVDFIIYGPDGIWAIEVKQSKDIRLKNLKGLISFKEDYPEAHCIILYRGYEKLKKGNILCIPCELFLKSLIPGKIIEF
jgi:predicted AAA+ superfamily ATPase